MQDITTVGVDLAKEVLAVCVLGATEPWGPGPRLFSFPAELPQTAGSSRLTAMRMFELRFLCNYGEASFRIARLEAVG